MAWRSAWLLAIGACGPAFGSPVHVDHDLVDRSLTPTLASELLGEKGTDVSEEIFGRHWHHPPRHHPHNPHMHFPVVVKVPHIHLPPVPRAEEMGVEGDDRRGGSAGSYGMSSEDAEEKNFVVLPAENTCQVSTQLKRRSEITGSLGK